MENKSCCEAALIKLGLPCNSENLRIIREILTGVLIIGAKNPRITLGQSRQSLGELLDIPVGPC